ncbi:DNL zinc finger-domain-containing protein, partial [Fimicolochytrium jonesii]|uniref:DNL zinc finger-domain-containing protein n=1 Tax=Fimicolochytrium jonesii TaxID=1396493 RepID=UPI0022FEED90
RMIIGFTCKVCDHRQHKYMSKKAYTEGVVIIRCDGCDKLHLMADHLGWFDSQNPPGTIEDILARKGQSVTK